MTTLSNSTREIKISVIIPVYNVEGYIDACIASLKGQTLKELEFIFVDDCGTDASMRLVEAFSFEDSRVRIIRNPRNLGAGPSRNAGIEAARGEYLSFVDPDDWLDFRFYEFLYQGSLVSQADIVKGTRIKVVRANSSQKTIKAANNLNKTSVNSIIRKTQRHKGPLFCVFTVEHQSAIYHHRLFDDSVACYGTTSNAEDTTFLLRVCLKQPVIKIEDNAVYYYVKRNGSATGAFSKKRAFEELASFKEKVDSVQASRGQWVKDEYTALYLIRMVSGYFTNAVASRHYYGKWDDNDIARYEQGLKESMQKVEQLFPHLSLPYSQFAELCAVQEYGRWIPIGAVEGIFTYYDVIREWTVFLTDYPDAEEKYIAGYAKSLIRAIAAGLTSRKDGRGEDSFKTICKQFKRLSAKQRQAVILAIPHSILLFIKRRIRKAINGFSK